MCPLLRGGVREPFVHTFDTLVPPRIYSFSTQMDHPAPAPEVEPPAHHPASPGGQQPPPHTIPNILLADLTGTEHPAHGSVVLTSTQRAVWDCVVGGLQEADREELRKACKTTAAVERVLASLPQWIEVVPPEEEEEEESDEEESDEEGSDEEGSEEDESTREKTRTKKTTPEDLPARPRS